MKRVVEISEHGSASVADGLVPKDLHRDAVHLLGARGTNETGQDEDVAVPN